MPPQDATLLVGMAHIEDKNGYQHGKLADTSGLDVQSESLVASHDNSNTSIPVISDDKTTNCDGKDDKQEDDVVECVQTQALSSSEENEALNRLLAAPSVDNVELDDDNRVLKRALTDAPEYVANYFELKRLHSTGGSKDLLQLGASPIARSTTEPLSVRRLSTGSEVGCITWGLPVKTVFNLALDYINAESRHVQLTYADRNLLFALKRQALKGPYSPDKMPNLGWFDWVGHDIKRKWEALGEMDVNDAMSMFCRTLEECSEDWKVFLLDEKRRIDAELRREWDRQQEVLRKAEEERQRGLEEESIRRVEEQRRLREEEEERERERERLRQLEEEKKKNEKNETEQPQTTHHDSFNPQDAGGVKNFADATGNDSQGHEHEHANSEYDLPYEQWIEQVRADPNACLVVPRGETVIVRVPIAEANTMTWWEFNVESYDINFGVSFEYVSEEHTQGEENDIDEQTDESADDGEEEDEENTGNLENPKEIDPKSIRTIRILPLLPKMASKTVVRGCHVSPCPGTYLLHFDNSYSYLRSKTLYYQVYAKS